MKILLNVINFKYCENMELHTQGEGISDCEFKFIASQHGFFPRYMEEKVLEMVINDDSYVK